MWPAGVMCHSHVLCGLDGHLAQVSKSIYAAAKKIKSAEASAGLAVKSDENNDNLTTICEIMLCTPVSFWMLSNETRCLSDVESKHVETEEKQS